MQYLSWVLLVLLSASIGGCASTTINDLEFSSLQVVGRHETPELKASDAVLSTAFSGFDPPNELLLKVTITTTIDLSMIEGAVSLHHRTSFCQRGAPQVRLALPRVYWQTFQLPMLQAEAQIRPARTEPNTRLIYHVFIRIALDEHGRGNPPFESFDLLQQPQDVCIQLVGGSYLAFGYHSNIVVVPKDEILAALRTVPRSEIARRCTEASISYVPTLGHRCASKNSP